MNWAIGILLDVILVAAVIICVAKGKKDGFAKTLVSFLSFFIALVLAGMLSAPLAEGAYTAVIEKGVTAAVTETVEGVMQNEDGDTLNIQSLIEAGEAAIDKLPAFVKNTINSEDIKAQIEDKSQSLINVPSAESIAKEIVDNIFKPAILSVLTALLFVIIFILALIICTILAKSLKLVNKIPLLGKVNEFLGGVIGLLKGVVIVFILNWALLMLVTKNGALFSVITAETLNSSLINKTLIEVNPINMIFSKFLG